MTQTDSKPNILHQLQLDHGGRMAEFGGCLTPLRYEDGIVKEHLHTRSAAGLFDVSHMSQAEITGKDVAQALEKLLPRNLRDQKIGKLAYTTLPNDNGGVIDDLIITRAREDMFLLVSNAGKRDFVNHYLSERLGDGVQYRPITDHSLVTLQGPKAAEVVAKLSPEACELKYMSGAFLQVLGRKCFVSRSGYTGEDGFEFSIPEEGAEAVVAALLEAPEVRWCGLGARDSLRLEAGLCLYGQDLDEDTTPVESGLSWTISKNRRAGGDFEGGFPGAEKILAQMQNPDTMKKRLIAISSKHPGVARSGMPLFVQQDQQAAVGVVTSGGFSPTLGCSIARGYLTELDQPDLAQISPESETSIYICPRGKFIEYQVQKLPFYSANR